MKQQLRLGLEEMPFAESIARELATPGVTPLAAVGRFASNQFASCLQETMGNRLIKAPAVVGLGGKGGFETLSRLAETGYETWYTKILFSTKASDAVTEMPVDPFGIVLEPIDYGYGVKRAHQLKTKSLKTQVNHELQLNHIRIPGRFFARALEAVQCAAPLSQPYIANPEPGLAGFRVVAFDHIIDGSRIFCECARIAHERMRSAASDIVGQYVAGSWPHHVLALLADPTYRDGICHLCVARVDGPEAAALKYGDNIQDFEESYIDQIKVDLGLDDRTARAEVQQLLGLSRWKSEALLFQIVKELLPDTTVQREASPYWLGRQRLDIFVPEFKLAIEYQGAQHFEAVSFFGGEEGFRKAVERDTAKKRLCDENGIALVYVRHTDPLTPLALNRRLRRFIR